MYAYLLTTLLYSIFPLMAFAADPLITYKLNVPVTLKKLLGYQADSLLNFTQIVTKYGYKAEEHNVTTEDGYILTTFRMTGGNCSTVKSIPVILTHGVFLDAYIFIDAGHKAGLAYLLADSCYDVWLGNNRGTPGGRAHRTLDPDTDASFWHFSYDEMGYYDVPAFIDYAINVTGSEKVNYIGYSQGGGTLAIALSERPEYNDKINLNIGLAPAVYISATKSPVARLLFTLLNLLQDLLARLGIQEVLFRGSVFQVVMELICHEVTLTRPVCVAVYTLIDNNNPGSIVNEALSLSYAHAFAGGSVQQFARYGQLLKSKDFSKYDYGSEKNFQVYGTERPPQYNISNVRVPSVFFTGEGDNLMPAEGVEWVAASVPNMLEVIYVNDTNWNHIDYIYSQKIPSLLYPKLNAYLSKYT